MVFRYLRDTFLPRYALPYAGALYAGQKAAGGAYRAMYGRAPPSLMRYVAQKSGVMPRRGTPARSSYLGGKVGKPARRRRAGGRRKTRRVLRRKKISRRFARKTLAEGGVEFQTETVGTVSDDDAVYIGHGSFAPQRLTQYLCYSLVKMILNRAGIVFSNWGQNAVQSNMQLNSTIAFVWRDTETDITNSFTVTCALLDTFTDIAERFWLAFYLEIDDGTISEKSVLLNIQFDQGNARDITKVNLNNITFDIFSKDSLKIQNRSVPTAVDDEVTNVDNIPLSGKMYMGVGNSFEAKNELANEDFVCNRITNVLQVEANTDVYLREPPQPYYFKNAKAVPVRLNPGEIKAHTIVYKKKMTLRKFITWAKGFWHNNSLQSDDLNRHDEGQVVMFGLEKVIGTGADGLGILIKYEVDQHLWIKCIVKENNFTTQIVV